MNSPDAEVLFKRGLIAYETGNTPAALSCFEKALDIEQTSELLSYYAYSVAKERGQINKAILLCREAIEQDTENTIHFLLLGKIYLLAGKRGDAIRIFREGLKLSLDERIIVELDKLGTRKPSVIPFISRNNPLNKYLGILLYKLKIR